MGGARGKQVKTAPIPVKTRWHDILIAGMSQLPFKILTAQVYPSTWQRRTIAKNPFHRVKEQADIGRMPYKHDM